MRPGEHQGGVVLTGAEVEEPGRGEAPEALGVVAEARVFRVLLLSRECRCWRHESAIYLKRSLLICPLQNIEAICLFCCK